MQSPKSQRLTGERERQLKRLLHGLAALPLLTGVALAETPKQSIDSGTLAKPIKLSEAQMDRVTAGSTLFATDIINLIFVGTNVNFLGTNSIVQTGAGLPQYLIYIPPIIAEDTAFQTAFQGATLVVTVEHR